MLSRLIAPVCGPLAVKSDPQGVFHLEVREGWVLQSRRMLGGLVFLVLALGAMLCLARHPVPFSPAFSPGPLPGSWATPSQTYVPKGLLGLGPPARVNFFLPLPLFAPPWQDQNRAGHRAPDPAPEAALDIPVYEPPAKSWPASPLALRPAMRVAVYREVNDLDLLVQKCAGRHDVDEQLIWAVIRQESGFNPRAVSPKGAMGLMQLMPDTAALMGVRDPFNVEKISPAA